MIRKKYQQLGLNFMSYLSCIKLENNEWKEKWEDEINKIIDSLPHGSGIDGKTEFNFEESKKHKLIINSGYHRMDENGFYDGWVDFKVIIQPGWDCPNINIKGNFGKKYDILKNYLEELFYEDLTNEWKIE